MISKDSPTTKEFVRLLYEQTKSSDFVKYSLSFIQTEENMKKIIEYIKENPNCLEIDINYQMVLLRP